MYSLSVAEILSSSTFVRLFPSIKAKWHFESFGNKPTVLGSWKYGKEALEPYDTLAHDFTYHNGNSGDILL